MRASENVRMATAAIRGPQNTHRRDDARVIDDIEAFATPQNTHNIETLVLGQSIAIQMAFAATQLGHQNTHCRDDPSVDSNAGWNWIMILLLRHQFCVILLIFL